MKQCSKCKITYHESNFSKDRTHKDNLASVCKDCRRESNIQYRNHRLKLRLCYDCGTPLPENHPYKRHCTPCLKKREERNIIYEQQRKDRGICRQCCKNPIDYSRSMVHCSICLDLRNYQAYG